MLIAVDDVGARRHGARQRASDILASLAEGIVVILPDVRHQDHVGLDEPLIDDARGVLRNRLVLEDADRLGVELADPRAELPDDVDVLVERRTWPLPFDGVDAPVADNHRIVAGDFGERVVPPAVEHVVEAANGRGLSAGARDDNPGIEL